MTVPTLAFKPLYVFVVFHIGSRRIAHINVTFNPTAQWTAQQLREAIPADHTYKGLIHDRDAIFSRELDSTVRGLGMRVLKTPPRAPTANAYCERVIGTIRRECTDHLIPLSRNHLTRTLKEWTRHYNEGRPHLSLGLNMPDPPENLPVPLQIDRHQLPDNVTVMSNPVLNGLHHEYRLEWKAA